MKSYDSSTISQEFLHNLEMWNEQNEYKKIIDAIESLPDSQKTPDLISRMARAYNNLAGPEDRELLKKAVELLDSVEEELAEDHNWNYRKGYALYYLDQELRARYYFEKALELRPGDEDTQEMIRECSRALTLPNSMKPFRVRTEEGWQSFLEGEGRLREMMDGKRQEEVVELCHQLLAPAFQELYFEMGYNGSKYELILSAEGNRARLFKLEYFKNHAPEEIFEKWNIHVGRQPSSGFELRMYGTGISTSDALVWVEDLEDKQVGLTIYCEKLTPLLNENENQAYSLMAILLDQAIGEIGAIRYAGYLELVSRPQEGSAIRLDELGAYIVEKTDPERQNRPISAGELCQWYTAYQHEPSKEKDWGLRDDVFAGSTCCVPIVGSYYRGDDTVMEDFHMDGAVPGFFYYPLEGIPRDLILDLRDLIEQGIKREAGDSVTFLGGATGTVYGYLDFIAWDLSEVLDAAVKVFRREQVREAYFHSFRRAVGSVCLKREEEMV